MAKIKLAIVVPDRSSPGVADQFLGARLAALHNDAENSIAAEEIIFKPEDPNDLERCLAPLRKEFSGVIGATNVPESTGLGDLSERLGLLCLVANNNPSVWNGKRQVFHIGIPSAQTSEAVALRLARLGIRQVQLLHDRTEFQGRAAASALAALQKTGIGARSQLGPSDNETEIKWHDRPELFYLLYSDEGKALRMARAIRRQADETPLLFGRSLLRRSFISALGKDSKEAWFVDLLPRTGPRSSIQDRFMRVLSQADVPIPTANHCFGWDAMALSCHALSEMKDNCEAAIDYLESGVVLESVAGSYRFDAANHNGRSGAGPTMLSRWREDHVEEIVDRY